jgi:hypothetical protein
MNNQKWGPAYNFTNNGRPKNVKAFDKLVRSLCKSGYSIADAESQAYSRFRTVRDWVTSEQLQGRSGKTYLGKFPCDSPNRIVIEPYRPNSPYSLNNPNSPLNPHSTRKRLRRSKKSRKSKKT